MKHPELLNPVLRRFFRKALPALIVAYALGGSVMRAQVVPWTVDSLYDLEISAPLPPAAQPAKAKATEPDAKRKRRPGALRLLPGEIETQSTHNAFDQMALEGVSSVLISSFSTSAESGAVRPGTSWDGNVTRHAGSISVGGSAGDDNGWGARISIDATGMNYLRITAQRDAGHMAPTLFVQFEDQFLQSKVFSVNTSLFAVGSLTTVQIPITSWTNEFGFAVDYTAIGSWSMGGGSVGNIPFHMTFDEISFTASAIPEPAAVSLLGGFCVLGAVAYRRWRRRS